MVCCHETLPITTNPEQHKTEFPVAPSNLWSWEPSRWENIQSKKKLFQELIINREGGQCQWCRWGLHPLGERQEKPTGKCYLNTNRRNANADISSVRAALDFSQGTPLQRRKWWLSHSAEEALSLQTLQLGMFSTEYSFVVVVVKKNKRLVQRNETWSRRRAAWTNCSTECFGFVLFSERMFQDWPRFCLEIEASRFPARNTPRLESWAEYRMNGASLLKVWENWNQMFKSYLSRILGSTELQRLLVFFFFFETINNIEILAIYPHMP